MSLIENCRYDNQSHEDRSIGNSRNIEFIKCASDNEQCPALNKPPSQTFIGHVSVFRLSSGSSQAGSAERLVQAVRLTRPIPVPQTVPVSVNRHVPVPVPQPYPVSVPKPYPVAVPHPVTVPVPRPYPVSVPRPVPVPVPHPVAVAVPHPVGVPVPKPYPVPVPHPVPVPSPFLVGGGIPFGGLAGEFLSLGHGAAGQGAGVLLAVPEGHGLTTGYGHPLSANGFSPVPQIPLPLPGFEPSSSGAGTEENTPAAGYSSLGSHQSAPLQVPGSGLVPGLSYVEGGKGAQPQAQDVVAPPSPAPPRDAYHYGPT